MAALRRSLAVYHGDPTREAALDAHYTPFVRPGDLVFDVGSHVGDRIGCFRRLGARVVAVEPQPLCLRALDALYGDDGGVTLVAAACGAVDGHLRLHVNSRNPTVSTASGHFLRAAHGAPGWADEVWDAAVEVAATRLDALIDRYGTPRFIKIDVEGYEEAVLTGLSRPPAALSFEFTTIERGAALRCLDRARALGLTEFNIGYGDDLVLALPRWTSAPELARLLRTLPDEANAGDVYCRVPRP
ncbi:FkbM family methyltransferase [Micromonospora sp. NPDC000089]|uniref:FkbM family methyltransferase n=1 Tax=unclassified Micromonospora TaxID=2617518 RepID=UPI0036D095C5